MFKLLLLNVLGIGFALQAAEASTVCKNADGDKILIKTFYTRAGEKLQYANLIFADTGNVQSLTEIQQMKSYTFTDGNKNVGDIYFYWHNDGFTPGNPNCGRCTQPLPSSSDPTLMAKLSYLNATKYFTCEAWDL